MANKGMANSLIEELLNRTLDVIICQLVGGVHSWEVELGYIKHVLC